MSFKDWCYHKLGIVEFIEGKVVNCVFIPAGSQSILKITRDLHDAGGYLVNSPYQRGLIIPLDNLKKIQYELAKTYTSRNLPTGHYSNGLNNYFLELGLDLRGISEYKEPASIHIVFNNRKAETDFLVQFKHFNPRYNTHSLSRKQIYQLPPIIIHHLLHLYYIDGLAEISRKFNTPIARHHLESLFQLEQIVAYYPLQQRLNYSMFLARDFSNGSKNRINLEMPQATSSYSLSLKVFAEINRDNLNPDQYNSLLYAASLLAAYTPDGKLKQSLKTDAKFILYLSLKFISLCKKGNASIYQHIDSSKYIDSLIEQNLNSMLYGSKLSTINNCSSARMARFLPGKDMTSDTDELIFQGGGTMGHSAVFRIIKVGFMTNGDKAHSTQKPDFYEYYKVEDNLGGGARGIDCYEKTCTGTYVTKLEPHAVQDGALVKLTISPYADPATYQQAMECTLKELIRTERLLMLYRRPSERYQTGSYSRPQSNEAKEWERLDKLKEQLSGQIYPHLLTYRCQDPLKPTQHYQRSVSNHRHFYQEGGSCLIFTLKSLVSSMIGRELATLHMNFMQLYDSQDYLHLINNKIIFLQSCISRIHAEKTASTKCEAVTKSHYEPISLASNRNAIFSHTASSSERDKEGRIQRRFTL